MSLLLVDVGNSRVKWALWKEKKFIQRGQLWHKQVEPAVLGSQLWNELLKPARVMIANVAGTEIRDALSGWIQDAWSLEPEFVYPQEVGFGLRNAYPLPQQMGVDRWVAMLGARCLSTEPCCVVDCGTAVTLDAVSMTGEHLGGVIIPGIHLMRESLYQNTRQIPAEDNGEITFLGRNTRNCVWGGTVYAVASAIDGITRRMEKAMGGKACRWLIGGDAETLLPYLEDDYRLESDLVFWGLLVIADKT